MRTTHRVIELLLLSALLAGCTKSSTSSASASGSAEKEPEETSTPEPTQEPAPETTPEATAETEAVEQTGTSEVAEAVQESAASAERSYTTVDSYNVYTNTDYTHCTDDVIILGNDETLYIMIQGSPNTLDVNDFWVWYEDSSMISLSVEDVTYDDDYTNIELAIKAKGETSGTFQLGSFSDLYESTDESNTSCVSFSILGLNSTEGKVVYAMDDTATYHYNALCSGGGGVETTLFDVEQLGYSPCTNCVK